MADLYDPVAGHGRAVVAFGGRAGCSRGRSLHLLWLCGTSEAYYGHAADTFAARGEASGLAAIRYTMRLYNREGAGVFGPIYRAKDWPPVWPLPASST